MNYTDVIGRIHDKPVTYTDPVPSNNGWLYSAVAKRLGYPVNVDPQSARTCIQFRERHPSWVYQTKSPMSRDEVLGLYYLGYSDSSITWTMNFSPFDLPKLNVFKLIKQLWQAKGKHRNYFWQNNLDQMYHLAFRVPLKDRHFLLSCVGKYSLIYHAIHLILHIKQPKDRSSRLLRFLKTGKDKEAVSNYFGPEHPLSKV